MVTLINFVAGQLEKLKPEALTYREQLPAVVAAVKEKWDIQNRNSTNEKVYIIVVLFRPNKAELEKDINKLSKKVMKAEADLKRCADDKLQKNYGQFVEVIVFKPSQVDLAVHPIEYWP